MDRIFTRIASLIAGWAGQPAAFLLAMSVVLAWAVTGPLFGFSDTWQLVINTGTTVLTFLAVFLIQNSQNRDGAAIQAKLDEIIRSAKEARSAFVGIEHLTDLEIAQVKAALEREVLEEGDAPPDPAEPSVDELLEHCRDADIAPPAAVAEDANSG